VPALWREEIYDPEDRLKDAEVHGGKNGPRWTYERHDLAQEARAVYMPRIPEGQETDTRFSFMFDPSETTFSEDFWDGHVEGRHDRAMAWNVNF
jgi:phenolic acid decarboxylase